MLSQKTIEYAEKQDLKLNEKAGYNANDIGRYLNNLMEFNRVEVGYRSSCGSTDQTMKINRIWVKVIKKLMLEGIQIKIEGVKHGNGSPTSAGGFWNSNIYSLI